jgi:hypothetical protein
MVWLIGAIAAAVATTYLFYTPYPEWWYLRFFLPILPMLTVLAVSVFVVAVRHRLAVVLVILVVAGFALTSEATAQALMLQRLEQRFRTAGQVVRDRLPHNAAFVTVWESGSVKYHAGREAVLWDSLDVAWLDPAMAWLTSRGFEPFIILEQWEEPLFRQRFAAHSEFGEADWPPRFDIDHQVRIFSVADRARYLAGENVPTEIVWSHLLPEE